MIVPIKTYKNVICDFTYYIILPICTGCSSNLAMENHLVKQVNQL